VHFAIARVRRANFYYGWFIVAAALMGMLIQGVIQAHSANVFLKPMTDDLGWSRTDFTWAQTMGVALMGFGGFFVGGMLDKQGPRRLMLAGALFASVSVAAQSQVHELWQYFLLRGVGVTLGSLLIGNLVVNVTVSKWFVRNRGWAIAFATTGISIGGIFLPPILARLIEIYGWRTSWVVLGVAVLLMLLPTALVMRRRPEDYGLLPDGDSSDGTIGAAKASPNRPNATSEEQWTRSEAIRTRSFWLLILAFGMASAGTGAGLLHWNAFFQDSGFSPEIAATAHSSAMIGALTVKLFWGAVMQRFHARHCAAVGFIFTAVSTVGLVAALNAENLALAYVGIMAWGLGFGGQTPLQEVIWASYYGREHLGSIRGVAMPFLVIATAGGPQFAARLQDATGSYTMAFLIFAGGWAVAVFLVLFARPPRHYVASTEPQPVLVS
jgi:MFS family permease